MLVVVHILDDVVQVDNDRDRLRVQISYEIEWLPIKQLLDRLKEALSVKI